MMRLVDMHMHAGFVPQPELLAHELEEADVDAFANTVTPEECEDLRERCSSCDNMRVGLGLHPWWLEARDAELNESMMESFLELLPQTRFIGEVGLDFSKMHADTRAMQIACFDEIVSACSMREGILMSLHAVRAEHEALDIIENNGLLERNAVILHSYGGSSEQLARAIKLGCRFSVGSRMLRTKRGREYARIIPEAQLLLESDLPSTKGQSIHAREIRLGLEETLEEIACIRDATVPRLGESITQRSLELLGLQQRP